MRQLYLENKSVVVQTPWIPHYSLRLYRPLKTEYLFVGFAPDPRPEKKTLDPDPNHKPEFQIY